MSGAQRERSRKEGKSDLLVSARPEPVEGFCIPIERLHCIGRAVYAQFARFSERRRVEPGFNFGVSCLKKMQFRWKAA